MLSFTQKSLWPLLNYRLTTELPPGQLLSFCTLSFVCDLLGTLCSSCVCLNLSAVPTRSCTMPCFSLTADFILTCFIVFFSNVNPGMVLLCGVSGLTVYCFVVTKCWLFSSSQMMSWLDLNHWAHASVWCVSVPSHSLCVAIIHQCFCLSYSYVSLFVPMIGKNVPVLYRCMFCVVNLSNNTTQLI